MSHLKQLVKSHKATVKFKHKIKVRKHLNADALFSTVQQGFQEIPDHRPGEVKISLVDTLMSGFAMFSLKDPSLLAFDARRRSTTHNLHSIYRIGTIPCDTSVREILDGVDPNDLRSVFKDVFRQIQRGKALEKMVLLDGYYLLNLDGTGYYSSEKVSSDACLKKVRKNGKTLYYLQMLGAAIVHPDYKEVIPLCPEMIVKQDGNTKNDCERNAAKRFFEDLRREHPHLPLIVNEDALSPNAPHIKELQRHDLRFILVVKPGDHGFLFDYVEQAAKEGKCDEFSLTDKDKPEMLHYFRFINGVPLNQSNPDLLVNFLEYWEVDGEGNIKHFSWVTDFTITRKNAYTLMRGGRARWKIENETFNTLKNQGYNFGHNYGLGKKHLSEVFVMLMMLAFLVDQAQQLCCALFRAAWGKVGSKRLLWEHMRSLFHWIDMESMEMLLRVMLEGKPIKIALE
jgi:hypothetical protein